MMNNPDIKGAITDGIKALELVEIVYDAWNIPSQHCEHATQALTKLQAFVEALPDLTDKPISPTHSYDDRNNRNHAAAQLLKEAILDE